MLLHNLIENYNFFSLFFFFVKDINFVSTKVETGEREKKIGKKKRNSYTVYYINKKKNTNK